MSVLGRRCSLPPQASHYPEGYAKFGGHHAVLGPKMAQRGAGSDPPAARHGGAQGSNSYAHLELVRQYHESDKQWESRKQFIVRHLHKYEGPGRLDHLLALSMVWSNHVFMGNRYGAALMQKVLEMADGIDIGEVPSYELVPGTTAIKRTSTAVPGQEPPSKQTPFKIRPRPRFEPVHFVASTVQEGEKTFETKEDPTNPSVSNCFDGTMTLKHVMEQNLASSRCFKQPEENSHFEHLQNDQFIDDPDSYDLQNKSLNDTGSYMSKMEQNYSAKFESHNSTLSKNFRTNVLDMWTENNKQGRKGIGFVKAPRKTGRISFNRKGPKKSVALDPCSLIQQREMLIQKLAAVVLQNLSTLENGSAADKINNTFMLTRCIQACKTNPEYIYVSLKSIPPSDLPRNKKLPGDGYACEVRCQTVYLATGYSGSKIGARDRAAEQAIRLLQKPVEVRSVQRKFKHGFQEDLVVCQSGAPTPDFPPALKEAEDEEDDASVKEEPSFEQEDSGQSNPPHSAQPWTSFVLNENASDAVCILNNSASFNKMKLQYKYDMMPNLAWRCRLFVQNHCVAEGYGNKKTSKHAAAEEAVRIIKKMQSNVQKNKEAQGNMSSAPIQQQRKNIKDLVVYEISANPVCTLHDTAQFNKVTVEYTFERVADEQWKCRVFVDSQFIAEGIGMRKNVKHIAAEEALRVLKHTQPTVVNKLRQGPVDEAISRNQICGRSAQEAYKEKIKDDNIGNQLLRKMGWTGGGLGKEGEGIAEPISVKEQFKREGLGLDLDRNPKVNKRDIEMMIRNYAFSYSQENLTFSNELTNDERKQIHQVAQRYGLKSKSHGQGASRFLVVSRKRRREDLIDELKQVGQVAGYQLVLPHSSQF
ncbi:NF-kappa-B-repressing factor [Ambystoma mexicanum]|uniref:NF-kappa-B-repressing factor n=1 Tax=Ambystoma mexicanum TaxID=8296 RepID=UPI0037E7EFB0